MPLSWLLSWLLWGSFWLLSGPRPGFYLGFSEAPLGSYQAPILASILASLGLLLTPIRPVSRLLSWLRCSSFWLLSGPSLGFYLGFSEAPFGSYQAPMLASIRPGSWLLSWLLCSSFWLLSGSYLGFYIGFSDAPFGFYQAPILASILASLELLLAPIRPLSWLLSRLH
jgi:hypothetical protein